MSETVDSQSLLEKGIEKAKATFNERSFDTWAETIKNQPAGHMMVAGAIGFLLGFLLKRNFRFIIFFIILSSVLALLLEHAQIITIDWQYVQSLIGIDAEMLALDNPFQITWQLIKNNIGLALVGLLGFFIGYKIGR